MDAHERCYSCIATCVKVLSPCGENTAEMQAHGLNDSNKLLGILYSHEEKFEYSWLMFDV